MKKAEFYNKVKDIKNLDDLHDKVFEFIGLLEDRFAAGYLTAILTIGTDSVVGWEGFRETSEAILKTKECNIWKKDAK